MCTTMPRRWAASHSAATSSAVYTVPSSVLWVIDTTPGWAWCMSPWKRAKVVDLIGLQLGVGGGHRHDLGAERALGRAGLVDGDVRPLGAHHEVGRLHHRCQRHHVGAGAVPHEERLATSGRTGRGNGPRPRRSSVGAVGQRMAGVRRDDRLDHRGVRAGGVVAGERPLRGGRHGGDSLCEVGGHAVILVRRGVSRRSVW